MQALGACAPFSAATEEEREVKTLAWQEYIKGNYRFMTEEERAATIARLERLSKLKRNTEVGIRSTDAQPGVQFGYAFNITKCKGYRACVQACINENNLDRKAATQYIRIFEMEPGEVIFYPEGIATPALLTFTRGERVKRIHVDLLTSRPVVE